MNAFTTLKIMDQMIPHAVDVRALKKLFLTSAILPVEKSNVTREATVPNMPKSGKRETHVRKTE